MRTLISFILFLCVSAVFGQTENYYQSRYMAKGEQNYMNPQQTPSYTFKTPIQLPSTGYKAKDNGICFNNVYFVRYNTVFNDVLEDNDGYYLTGYCHNQTSKPLDSLNLTMLFRAKLDSLGNVIWLYEDSLMNGDHFRSSCHSIIKLSDGSFLANGNINYDFGNPKDYESLLAIYHRFDKDGNLIFSKLIADTVGRRYGFWSQEVVAEPDMGFTVAGFIGSQTRKWHPQDLYWQHDTTYIAIISYDSLGNETKRVLHYIGGEPRTPGVDGLIKLRDGSYLISGTQLFNYPASPLRKNYILHIDSNFNFISVKTFGQMIGEIYVRHHIIPSRYGGYCFAVNLADTPLTQTAWDTYYTYYYHVGRMDSTFTIIKDTIFRHPGIFPPHPLHAGIIKGLDELENGDIVMAENHAQGAKVFWFNNDINVYRYRHIWYYPGQYPAALGPLITLRKARDGGVLLVSANLGTHRGGWFVKTDTLGYSLPDGGDTLMHIGIEIYGHQASKKELVAYPNPTTDYLSLQTKDNSPLPQGKLQILNLQGALQMEINIPKHQSQFELNLRHLPVGLYLGRIVSSSGEGGSFRVVKE